MIESRKTAEAIFIPEGGTVVWKNDDISEVTAVVGSPTGVPFLFPDKRRSGVMTGESSTAVAVGVDKFHRRHSFMGTIRIGKNTYEIVLKGTGLLDKRGSERKWYVQERLAVETGDIERYLQGLCDIREAIIDARVAQMVNRLGGVCAIPLTISAYKKVPYQGDPRGRIEFLSVDELKQHGILPVFPSDPNAVVDQLVAYARAFETNMRLDETNEVIIYKELLRLFAVYGMEMRADTMRAFFIRSVERIAKTVGVIHALRFENTEYGPQNITLSGEITDLSACVPLRDAGQESDEFRTIMMYIGSFFSRFERVFKKHFPSEPFENITIILGHARDAYTAGKTRASEAIRTQAIDPKKLLEHNR